MTKAILAQTKLTEEEQAKYLEITLKFDELIAKLRSGLIDMAVITSPCDNTLLNSFKVGQEKMTAFMSKDNPLAALPGNTIDLSMLKDKPLIISSRESMNRMITKWFKEQEYILSHPLYLAHMIYWDTVLYFYVLWQISMHL